MVSTSFDLSTVDGRRLYLQHVFGKHGGNTAEELDASTAQVKLLSLAHTLTYEWFMEHGLNLGIPAEEFRDQFQQLSHLLLRTTTDNVNSITRNMVESTVGPLKKA